MKKIHYILAFIVLTISILSIYLIFDSSTPIPIYEFEETVSLFELKRNRNLYLGKKVWLQGNIVAFREDSGSLYYYLESIGEKCDIPKNEEFFGDCPTIVHLDFVNQVKQKEIDAVMEVVRRNEELKPYSFQDGEFGVEVKVRGYIDELKLDRMSLYIKVLDIQQISPVRFISHKEKTGEQ